MRIAAISAGSCSTSFRHHVSRERHENRISREPQTFWLYPKNARGAAPGGHVHPAGNCDDVADQEKQRGVEPDVSQRGFHAAAPFA